MYLPSLNSGMEVKQILNDFKISFDDFKFKSYKKQHISIVH